MSQDSSNSATPAYKKSACILCSINCGLDIQTGGKDGRELLKIKGDKDHISSEGYLCNKAARLNHYQMGNDRLTSPMRRKADGSYEAIDWDTAIREVAAGLRGIKETHGGDKIYLIGGGGQGNHLGGMYLSALTNALGVKYQTNPLAQEKTGEFWVQGKMFGGGGPHGDFHNAEVAVFVGKNPWQTHGFPQTRKVLREIAKDPARTMIVLDPALTDTAKMADIHLRVKPGTDAWCLSAMVATLIQENLVDHDFIGAHTSGYDEIKSHFEQLSITEFAAICDVDESLIRKASRIIAASNAVSVFEDLGTQQNVHSTLVSYVQRFVWILTGNFAKKGTQNIPIPFLSITEAAKQTTSSSASKRKKASKVSPVLGSRVIAGLLPCNEVPDEILTDHPDRFRAAIIQSSNPVHSYADSPRMREAIDALEFSVVIDVAMTETAKHADYVLPAASQFEKHECTFFSVEYPRNHFHLRQPIVAPLPGTLPEAEIHTRLLEELGALDTTQVQGLNSALEKSRLDFAMAFMGLVAEQPKLLGIAPALLYRTLGKTLENGDAAIAAPLWAACHQFAQGKTQYARNAGFEGNEWEIGEAMFHKLLNNASGFIYTESSDYADNWDRVGYPDKRIALHIKELFPQLVELDQSLLQLPTGFPFVMSAGNRRATTSNTIIRDASWDKKDSAACLEIHPEDAQAQNLSEGDWVTLSTPSGSAATYVSITEAQRPGTLSLPNGFGLDYQNAQGETVRVGIAPNELTATNDKDFFAGTPWHKYVPARIEKLTRQN